MGLPRSPRLAVAHGLLRSRPWDCLVWSSWPPSPPDVATTTACPTRPRRCRRARAARPPRSSSSTRSRPGGDGPDWIELYNRGADGDRPVRRTSSPTPSIASITTCRSAACCRRSRARPARSPPGARLVVEADDTADHGGLESIRSTRPSRSATPTRSTWSRSPTARWSTACCTSIRLAAQAPADVPWPALPTASGLVLRRAPSPRRANPEVRRESGPWCWRRSSSSPPAASPATARSTPGGESVLDPAASAATPTTRLLSTSRDDAVFAAHPHHQLDHRSRGRRSGLLHRHPSATCCTTTFASDYLERPGR